MKRIFRKYSLPGLKRWIVFIAIGLVSVLLGLALVFKAHPVTRIAQLSWNTLSYIADHVPPTISGLVAITLGIFLLLYSFFRANKQVLNLVAPDEESLFETLDRAHMQGKGFKVVAIGGGTGLSNMLKGIKTYTSNITAVVTVADDGGSSGRLRKSLNIVPPGDIRNCIAALSRDDEVITQLFQYRFDEDGPEDLKNHSFGNLFLTALVELGGSKNMADAVKHACRILKARGTVLPVSNEAMHICAELEDGRVIDGESNIPKADGVIKKLFCQGEVPEVLPEVLEAVKAADVIVLGPGSLYTSILPNLLFPDLVQAICNSSAVKIYVCNVMTQPGETTNFKVSDHVSALYEHAKNYCEGFEKIIDYAIVNNSTPHAKQLEKYKKDKQYPVEFDAQKTKKLPFKVYPTNLLQKGNLVRHNPYKLAKAIMEIYAKQLRSKNREVVRLLNTQK